MPQIIHRIFKWMKRMPDAEHFTIMFIRGSNKLRSFTLSAPLFFGALIFLVLYITLSIVFINLYFNGLWEDSAQSKRLAELQAQIRDTREVLEGAKQRLRLLGDRISVKTENSEPKAGSGKPDGGGAIPRAEQAGNMPQAGSLLDVQRFSARKDREQLRIHFRLVNIDPDSRPLSGYAVMIAMNSETDPTRYWTYPRLALENGIPVNFEDGEYFKIRNYRTVRGKYALEKGGPSPTSVTILAYDESGRLIMKKKMGIDG